MGIKISRATKRDRKSITSYLKHYGSEELVENQADCYTTHNRTIMAKDGAKIAGMLQWQIKEDPRAGVVEFEEIHILEEYRNKGIASQMLDFAINDVIKHFKKIDIAPRKIFLFVSKNNDAGRRLYEKHGFVCIAEAGNLFSDAESELIYVLDLREWNVRLGDL